jgi:hypothetical protein
VIIKLAIKSDPERIGTSRSDNNIENIIDNRTGTTKPIKASPTVSKYQKSNIGEGKLIKEPSSFSITFQGSICPKSKLQLSPDNRIYQETP